MKMVKADENMAYVGTLQDLGRPYSMLFVDKEKRQLYILVRISDNESDSFLVVGVSPFEVESYMNESLGLLNIMNKKSYRLATINNDRVSLGNENFNNFLPSEQMKKMNMFDPQLCEDDVWLEIFLNRINNNQPIEIA